MDGARRCIVQLSVLGYVLAPVVHFNTWWLVMLYAGVMLAVSSAESISRPGASYKVHPCLLCSRCIWVLALKEPEVCRLLGRPIACLSDPVTSCSCLPVPASGLHHKSNTLGAATVLVLCAGGDTDTTQAAREKDQYSEACHWILLASKGGGWRLFRIACKVSNVLADGTRCGMPRACWCMCWRR